MSLVRILFRRADNFVDREADIGEPFYDANIGTAGVGDGTLTPPRFLAEHKAQPVSNKTIDGSENTLSNISPNSFADPQFGVDLLQGVISSFPTTGALKVVSPVMDVNSVNQMNLNFAELRSKVNEIILLLREVNLSK